MKKPIAISLSPNSQRDDILLALKILFRPYTWFDSRRVRSLEKIFEDRYVGYKALAVNSGRSAEYLILQVLGMERGDEVIVQAFSCIAVPNSVTWAGAKPVYVDVDKNFNIDVEDLKRKISRFTRAIIVQNTFGVPAEIETIRKIADPRGIVVINDCAHSLGAIYKNEDITFSVDISFCSFGRDKSISSVFGGMILCRDNDFYKKCKKVRDRLSNPSFFWVFQQVIHPVLFVFILSLYNFFNIGKVILYFAQKVGVLSKAIYSVEKTTGRPVFFPAKMPGALARLALNQFNKLDAFNSHRKQIAEFYFKKINSKKIKLPENKNGSTWLRFPFCFEDRDALFGKFKSGGILLGDWYKDVLSPTDNLAIFGYMSGSCPNAERYSKEILNLPTYPNLSLVEAERIVSILNNE